MPTTLTPAARVWNRIDAETKLKDVGDQRKVDHGASAKENLAAARNDLKTAGRAFVGAFTGKDEFFGNDHRRGVAHYLDNMVFSLFGSVALTVGSAKNVFDATAHGVASISD